MGTINTNNTSNNVSNNTNSNVVYSTTTIQQIVDLLNSMTVQGISNANIICGIVNLLTSEQIVNSEQITNDTVNSTINDNTTIDNVTNDNI